MSPLLIVALFLTGALALLVYDMAAEFARADGTIADRVKAAFRGSLTVFVAQATAVVAGAPLLAETLANALGDPAIAQAVSGTIPAEWRNLLPVAIAVLTVLARLRTLKS